MKFEAIIFDLDGTLLNTLDDLATSVNHALSEMGYPERTKAEVCDFVGTGVRILMERAMPEGATTQDVDRCLASFTAHYMQNMDNLTAPYPGIMELLDTLNARGIQVGVLSNKVDTAVKPLAKKYFGDRVTLAMGEREGVRKKPAPDALHEILHLMGVDASRALYSGDSQVDVLTGQNAGVSVIAVSWGFRSREALLLAGADCVIDRVDQFLTEMEKMEKE